MIVVNRVSLSSACLLALVFAPPLAWAQQPRSDYHGPHMMWEGGWMFLGPLMMFALIAVIVVVVVLLLRGHGGDKPAARTSSESRADDILKERFARGEIDEEQYEERRRILRD
jgi:putative membrane protein